MIDALKRRSTSSDYANIHRGVYELSQRATAAARRGAAQGPAASSAPPTGARSSSPATPPRPSTWSRRSFLRPKLQAGDEILVTEMEHHANIVPWQMVAEPSRCARWWRHRSPIPASSTWRPSRADHRPHPHDRGRLGLQRAGHGQPGRRARRARPARAVVPILIDAAQAVQHLPVDVQALGRRLPRLLRPQALRPVGRRRALGPRPSSWRRCRPTRVAAT